MNTRWKPSATVAAIIERDGRYLLIEEHTPEGLRLNNPARHRSPLVLRCIEDHLAGRRYPMDVVCTDPSVYAP